MSLQANSIAGQEKFERLDKLCQTWYNILITTRNCKGQNMRHEETRDNTTAIEANLSEADAREDVREDGPTWDECQCEACTEFSEAEAEYIRGSRHIRLVDEPHEEYEDGANGYEDDPNFEEYQTYIEGMGW